MEINNIVSTLAALAQASRLAVFRLLVQAGPEGLPAGKISELAGIPSSSLSFHLKELLHADLVSSRPDGRFVVYTANFSTVDALLLYLTENCCGGNPCTAISPPCCPTTEETPS